MNTNSKQPARPIDADDKISALISNSSAIQALASAVEGTLGPKGLNCMLVDRLGDVTITNDGSTILDRIETNHPAAGILIRAAKSQDAEVGDGTTTTVVLASALITEGINQVSRGVPVSKVIEGMSIAVHKALDVISAAATPITGLDDPILRQAAYISGRECADISDLVVSAIQLIGKDILMDPAFRLADAIVAKEGAENEVFMGLIIDKERMNSLMPHEAINPIILVVNDALEPEQMEDDALGTESGFARYLHLQSEFKAGIQKIINMGVMVVAVYKSVSDIAEEMLTDAGIIVLRRLSSADLTRIAEHTGARGIKRTSLNKPADELLRFTGRCQRVYEDERLEHTRIIGGAGKPAATILVGAATREVKDERKRIADDAASAAQAVVKGGSTPGGGSIEIAAAREVYALRESIRGMAAYGAICVAQALKKPLSQIVTNAGFNPLEKVEDVITAQSSANSISLAINCDTGEVADMCELGVFDPALVKMHALKTAAEVAEAILRINTIIRKRESDQPAIGGM